MSEQEIRRDERMQLAALLRDNADTLAKFAADKATLVQLIALMLELPNNSDLEAARLVAAGGEEACDG